jgi:hypothetical protein
MEANADSASAHADPNAVAVSIVQPEGGRSMELTLTNGAAVNDSRSAAYARSELDMPLLVRPIAMNANRDALRFFMMMLSSCT